MASNGVLTAFVIITALAMVMQACILLVMAFGARKTQTEAMAIVEELRASLTPILATTRQVLDDTAPKIKNITANLEHGSEVLRDQSDNLQAAMDDVVRRSRRHVEHADMIVAEALETVDQTRASVSHLVAQPLKWAHAIANGLRAGLENYTGRKRSNGEGYATHAAYEPESEEIFD